MSTAGKRTIGILLNLETGESIEAEVLFDQPEHDIFKLRNELEHQLHSGVRKKVCLYCKNPLVINGRKRLDQSSYFFLKHPYKSDDCLIKSTSYLSEEQIRRIKYNGYKESELHFKIKNEIGDRLSEQLGASNVKVDQVYRDKAISMEWRKPDVLADCNKLKLAFELQLTTTFLSVIVERTLFYKQHGIFLIWVFHEFSVNSDAQKFTQKDIFYNNQHNVFVFDEEARDRSRSEKKLILKCMYQDFSIQGLDIIPNWRVRFISIEDLTYNADTGACYYIDAEDYRQKLIQQLALKKEALAQEERRIKIAEQVRTSEEARKRTMIRGDIIDDCLQYLRDYYVHPLHTEKYLARFAELNLYEVEALNEKLQFVGEKLHVVRDVFFDDEKRSFLKLVCETDAVDVDFSAIRINGQTLLRQVAHLSETRDFDHYAYCIFRNGYNIDEQDHRVIDKLYDQNFGNITDYEKEAMRRWAILSFYSKLNDRHDVPLVDRHSGILLSILSLKEDACIGYNFSNLRQVTHNVLAHKRQYGEIYLRALKHYDRWDAHVRQDLSGKFVRNSKELEANMPEQDATGYRLICQLFPELPLL